MQAVYLTTSSKKGVSAHRLHRIREAMRSGDLGPMGGDNGIVEVDETCIGVKKGTVKRSAYHRKMAVLSLVGRATGEAYLYRGMGKVFVSHEAVRHGFGEYVRGDAHTNTIEGYFSIFKRGMRGIYQHCGEQHLHRCLADFDFHRTNREALGCNDTDRSVAAIKGIVGKRLTYARPD